MYTRTLRYGKGYTGSPWETMTVDEIGSLLANRGEYHPILDPLGF